MNPRIYFVVPDGIDDPDRPSGGNVYDQQLRAGLRAAGCELREMRGDAASAAATIPHGAIVIVDGLISSAALVPHARRLRLIVLLHMPVFDGDERSVLSAAAGVITTSAWARERVLAEYALDAAAVRVAYPGVDAAPVSAGTPAGGELLCVGAVAAHKGHDLLVDALGALEHRDWRCTVVGPLDRDPGYVGALRRRVAGLGLADRISLAGAQTPHRLARTYAAADLLVLPSRVEAYGMVVTEALARGLPVVAADVGGIREALGRTDDGGIPGLLVPPDDPRVLAAALDCWLGDAPLRARLRRTANARRASLPSWSATTESVLAAVNALAGVARTA